MKPKKTSFDSSLSHLSLDTISDAEIEKTRKLSGHRRMAMGGSGDFGSLSVHRENLSSSARDFSLQNPPDYVTKSFKSSVRQKKRPSRPQKSFSRSSRNIEVMTKMHARNSINSMSSSRSSSFRRSERSSLHLSLGRPGSQVQRLLLKNRSSTDKTLRKTKSAPESGILKDLDDSEVKELIESLKSWDTSGDAIFFLDDDHVHEEPIQGQHEEQSDQMLNPPSKKTTSKKRRSFFKTLTRGRGLSSPMKFLSSYAKSTIALFDSTPSTWVHLFSQGKHYSSIHLDFLYRCAAIDSFDELDFLRQLIKVISSSEQCICQDGLPSPLCILFAVKVMVQRGALHLLKQSLKEESVQHLSLLIAFKLSRLYESHCKAFQNEVKEGSSGVMQSVVELFMNQHAVLTFKSLDVFFRHMIGKVMLTEDINWAEIDNISIVDTIISQTIHHKEMYCTILHLLQSVNDFNMLYSALKALALLVTSSRSNQELLFTDGTYTIESMFPLLERVHAMRSSKLFSLVIFIISGCLHYNVSTMESPKSFQKLLQHVLKLIGKLNISDNEKEDTKRLILFGTIHRNLEHKNSLIRSFMEPIFQNTFIILSVVGKMVLFKDKVVVDVYDHCLLPDSMLVKSCLSLLKERSAAKFGHFVNLPRKQLAMHKQMELKLQMYTIFFEDVNDYMDSLNAPEEEQMTEDEAQEIISRIACALTDSFWTSKISTILMQGLRKAFSYTNQLNEFRTQFIENRRSESGSLSEIDIPLDDTFTPFNLKTGIHGASLSVSRLMVVSICHTLGNKAGNTGMTERA